MKPNYDVVKRWVNEAQEAVSSDNTMVQVQKIEEIISMELMLVFDVAVIRRPVKIIIEIISSQSL